MNWELRGEEGVGLKGDGIRDGWGVEGVSGGEGRRV